MAVSIVGEWLRSRAITEADTNTTVAAIDIPARTLVFAVAIVITEAFAGGTPGIDVGDGDDADGWIDVSDITETATGIYWGTTGNGAAYRVNGKYYTVADTIDIALSASLTDGTAYVLAYVIRLADVVS